MLESWSSHLSPCPSETSSTRSSHLSVYTAASSFSSPPPSPTGSKTYAFFASPFSDDAATPQPPPNPHSRQSSEPKSESEVSTDDKDTPKFAHKAPSRSLNAEFFGVSLLPTPPPSIRSLSHSTSVTNLRDTDAHSVLSDDPGSRDASMSPPPHRHRVALPPLSRFFPSRARYGSESDSPHPSPSSYERTNVRREFVLLDSDLSAPHGHGPSPDFYHAGEHTASPVDDLHPIARPLRPPSTQVTPTPTAPLEQHPEPAPGPAPTQLQSHSPPTPPPSEPELLLPTKPEPGATLSSSSLTLELVKPLGTGSFSSVWLARDTRGQLNALELVRKSSLARSKSLRGRRSRTIDGTRPTGRRREKARVGIENDNNDNDNDDACGPTPKSPLLSPKDEVPPNASAAWKEKERQKKAGGRLVAVKMTERAVCDASSRSRVSFVREVEVLRVSVSIVLCRSLVSRAVSPAPICVLLSLPYPVSALRRGLSRR
ncbi:hypothetical protein BD311DRAFT_462605 [Dichomitus squalens]|uniref:Protein kinase domain-containing protein n=1 Tax=Dichomitus squalens TaxID=114155 RepID=A0A4Q9MFE5_9APHY|nr:hypothetical protein BD311DRAFT_462605 [Dichomitus squalens]